jgi:hypothetical protein
MHFKDELAALLNKHSKENESDTPDCVLAAYISYCLGAFSNAVIMRDRWYGFKTLTMDNRTSEHLETGVNLDPPDAQMAGPKATVH